MSDQEGEDLRAQREQLEHLQQQVQALEARLQEAIEKTDDTPSYQQDIEAQLLSYINLMELQEGKASTSALATYLHLSEVQTWRYLRNLEKAGTIQRIGARGGWMLNK